GPASAPAQILRSSIASFGQCRHRRTDSQEQSREREQPSMSPAIAYPAHPARLKSARGRSAPQQALCGGAPLFPPRRFAFRSFVGGLRTPEAEKATDPPRDGATERRRNDSGIEDRDPAAAEPFGAGRQPQRKDCSHGGILRGFRHGPPAESMSDAGVAVGKDSEMTGGLAQPCEFQRGIALRPLAALGAKALGRRRL